MPETVKEVSDDDRPAYLVHGKMFSCSTAAAAGRCRAGNGRAADDVLTFRVDGAEAKRAAYLADRVASFVAHFRRTA